MGGDCIKMIDELYSEGSFKKQISEGGHVSFKNLPCPVHGSYPSSISLTGFGTSVACCREQAKWVEREVERLGLSSIIKTFQLQADMSRQSAIKHYEEKKKGFERLGTELIGAKIILCNSPDCGGFGSIIIEANEGKRYRIYSREDGVGVEQEQDFQKPIYIGH